MLLYTRKTPNSINILIILISKLQSHRTFIIILNSLGNLRFDRWFSVITNLNDTSQHMKVVHKELCAFHPNARIFLRTSTDFFKRSNNMFGVEHIIQIVIFSNLLSFFNHVKVTFPMSTKIIETPFVNKILINEKRKLSNQIVFN